MIDRSIGKLYLYMQSLIRKRLLSKDQEVRRENDLKTRRFVLMALDRWTRMVSCLAAQKDESPPPAVVNDVAFLSTSSLVMLDVITFLTTSNLIYNSLCHFCSPFCPFGSYFW